MLEKKKNWVMEWIIYKRNEDKKKGGEMKEEEE